MKRASITTAVFAGLMGLAGASFGQTILVPAQQPDPAQGAEASTQTQAGVAVSPTTRADEPVSREAVKAEARAHNRNNANNPVPKGEASTTVNHQPNAMPRPTGEMSRTDVSMQSRKIRPRFGEPGERPDVPTNPTDRTGTPQ